LIATEKNKPTTALQRINAIRSKEGRSSKGKGQHWVHADIILADRKRISICRGKVGSKKDEIKDDS
jgi:hypothetical protein